MRRTGLVVAVALLALAGGAVWWWNATFVRAPTKFWVGTTGEARLRPFLAAERFVARMGLKTRELRAVPDLDTVPSSGVILLPAGRQGLDGSRLGRILAWVQNGGHLIAESEPLIVADPLFDLLGVRRIDAPYVDEPLVVESPSAGAPLRIALRAPAALEPPTSRLQFRAASGSSLRLASFTRGGGVVTVVVSLEFLRNPQVPRQNPRIGEEDHAQVLWRLMQATPATELAVFWNPERLSLWDFLKDNAMAVLAAGAALLGAWVWRIAPRFGPVAPDLPPARRRLLDHLRASGRYYWALGLRERLLVAARDAALRRVLRAQPEFATAKPQERAAHLAALAGIGAEEAQRLLDAGGAIRGAAFIQIMQTAQRVHAALERGDR